MPDTNLEKTKQDLFAELGTTYKRTGFHFDKRLEKMGDTIKYLKKNEALSFKTSDDAITHKLIIGDNYDALQNLLIEYRGKIDVIYIDPPYGKDSMGEFAQTNYDNAITRDNLLSMLYPRLVLARQLLSDSGVIFCSIDDRNQAYVRGLFDEVFGESNFVGTLIHQRAKGGGMAKHLVKGHDYIHVFSKEIDNIEIRQKKVIQQKVVERDGELYIINDDIFRRGFGRKERDAEHRCYFYEELITDDEKRAEIEDNLKSGEYFLKEYINGKHLVARYERLDDAYSKVYTIMKVLSEDGKNELDDILDENSFDYPKPVELVVKLIEMSAKNNTDAIVLDFFAGSGTTGQAVLELNKQDGGNRQFILATANEITDTTPNGIVADVTSKRLKRVMTGECYDGSKDFKWVEKNQPLGDNLDVYDIATASPYSKEPFEAIDETIYGQEKLNVNGKIKWVCENFDITQASLEKDAEYKERIWGEENE